MSNDTGFVFLLHSPYQYGFHPQCQKGNCTFHQGLLVRLCNSTKKESPSPEIFHLYLLDRKATTINCGES